LREIKSQADFQSLAEQRLMEAKQLLDSQLWSGAYYLAGYAVELALKSCVIKLLLKTDEFPIKKFSEKCYTHKLEDLIDVARLVADWNAAISNPQFESAWQIVRRWSEQSRYYQIDQVDAEMLYEAITQPAFGVFPWIKTVW
jgi:HEPN domain-containing protein